MNEEIFRINKNVISFSKLDDKTDDREFWLSKPYAERLQAVELLRILMYGYDPNTARLQRVFETAEFKTS